jgi:cell division protein FtsL
MDNFEKFTLIVLAIAVIFLSFWAIHLEDRISKLEKNIVNIYENNDRIEKTINKNDDDHLRAFK